MVPTEDEAIVRAAIDGLETEVIVIVLPFIGKLPLGVTAALALSTIVTSVAALKAKATVLPAIKPEAGSIPKVKVLVCPALMPKLRPLKVIIPLEIELN